MVSVLALLGCAGAALAFPGPDVIVGDCSGISNYGSVGTTPNRIFAYAVGTTSCNAGTQPLMWVANTNQHPVIAQNFYRFRMVNGAGQFEHIGGGHLKHGYTALQQTLCFSDCQPTGGTTLGVHCSDPYVSSLNGTQTRLGPRDDINPYNGFYNMPWTSRGTANSSVINRRLQVLEVDIDPNMNNNANLNAIYICEGQYVAPDDAISGNGTNNASWRRITRGGTTSNWTFNVTSTTVREQAAIFAWPTLESGVTIETLVVPGEEQYRGTMHVAYKVTPIAGGMYHYEYMVHNQTSHIGANSFTVNFPSGGQTSCIDTVNVGFRDIFYHSMEPYDGTDWAGTKTSSGYQWVGPTFATAPNGNALRWSTSYSFRFDSNRPPVMGTGTIGLFRTGGSMSVNILVPDTCACPDPDINCDGAVNGVDVEVAEAVVGGDMTDFCGTDADLNGDGAVNGNDVEYQELRVGGAPC
ncbi:MAG: hypothetical protein HBSAPP03_00800 [Phycisphaerae bacterium]|nr:MAG: hypothetical protein HBSAPP03_00800 [Phycisphaerae bacterium]